ncbi:MAG: DoxX family protein [Hyphomicrobiales bacterium]|nr:DoxX family protein [Hyphomicrobiales bacterium]
MKSRTPHASHPLLSYADGVAASLSDILILAGRVCLGWIYMQSGYAKIWNMAAVAKTYPARGLPEFMAYVATPIELFVGIFIILGFATRYSAVVILVFTIVASFSSHAYWNFTDAAQRMAQLTQFWKNVSMMGGLILLFVVGGGRLSIDWLLRPKSSSRI